MNTRNRITALTLTLMTGFTMTSYGTAETAIPSQSFLGQPLPTDTPAIFAPGIISDAGYRLHGVPAFSPTGDEVFWPVIPPALMHMVLTDSGWTKPEAYPLAVRGVGSPVFSRDGECLYFQGVREDGYGSLDIWYLQKGDGGWSEPLNFGSPPNTAAMESQPSFTSNGDMYYTGTLDSAGMNRGIYVSRVVEGEYTDAVLLHEAINTPGIDYTPFVSPGGRYLLFASSRPTAEESDLKLYVSFATDDGRWGPAQNLSTALGLTASARFPALTLDGKWLFFLSEGSVYWIAAAAVEGLRNRQQPAAP